MDTKPRNPKIVKMEQNDRKINFDSTSTKAQLIFFLPDDWKHETLSCKS